MKEFENEINEAKRRVMEMNEKADKFSREMSSKGETPPSGKPQKSDDSSLLLILALTVILSKENTDSKILLALLYLMM